jgi:homoserine O-acetyltransferase/O-succinyltransferase
VRAFGLHTGEGISELRLHHTTVGAAFVHPVPILHGKSGSGSDLSNLNFSGALFGPGQPLDASDFIYP